MNAVIALALQPVMDSHALEAYLYDKVALSMSRPPIGRWTARR